MLGISWPTYGFYFLIFIAFTPLIHLIESNKNENIFKLTFFSFVTFMVWNIITTHWLYYATLTGMLFAIIVNSNFNEFNCSGFLIYLEEIKLQIVHYFFYFTLDMF